ncbi:hypothetical protein DITRI_Ditri20bG0042800 [Diplodiscus trichospermus]
MVAWNIWRQRNSKLWNNSFLTEEQAVFSALEALCDWVAAKEKKGGPSFAGSSLATDLTAAGSSGACKNLRPHI